MAGVRAAIIRHLSSNPWNRPFNIIRDREFKQANNLFVGLIKDLKLRGLSSLKLPMLVLFLIPSRNMQLSLLTFAAIVLRLKKT